MLLKLDENNYIQGYAIIGGLDGAIEVDLSENDIPFPYYEAYQYIDGQFILDEEKLQEIKDAENNKPLTPEEMLLERIAKLEALVAPFKQEGDSLILDAGIVNSVS